MNVRNHMCECMLDMETRLWFFGSGLVLLVLVLHESLCRQRVVECVVASTDENQTSSQPHEPDSHHLLPPPH